MRRRSSRNRGPLLLAAAGAAAVASAAAAGALRLRRRRAAGGEQAATREYVCSACGAQYTVAGTDRHRIYWPAGAPESQPLLEANCTSCGTPLPREHEVEPATA